MVLFGGFHGFDDSGGESVVLQFIDPLDRDSARSGNVEAADNSPLSRQIASAQRAPDRDKTGTQPVN